MQYMLAPIEDYTDSCFRTLSNADLTFTELSTISSLARNNSLKRIQIPDQTPTQIQLLGQKETDFKKFLDNFKPENGNKRRRKKIYSSCS